MSARGTAMVLIAFAALAACGPAAADPAYEKLIVDIYPTHNQTATSAFVMDCGAPKGDRVDCRACNAEILVDPDDTVRVYAHTDEHRIEGVPQQPHITVTGELQSHNNKVEPAVAKVEKAKGADAYAKYLTGLYEDANTWCAGFGGTRHEMKNVIADVAHGKYVK